MSRPVVLAKVCALRERERASMMMMTELVDENYIVVD